MTPEVRRVFKVLAKYKVTIPVGALEELGMIQRPAPLPYEQLREIAARRGLVRWFHSGVVERVVPNRFNPQAFTAWGSWTRPHFIPIRPVYYCAPYPGNWIPYEGDPTRIHPHLVRPEVQRNGRRA